MKKTKASVAACSLLLRWRAAALASLLVVAAPARAQQAAPTPPDRADQLVAEGIELGKQRKWAEARTKLAEASKIRQAYDIVGNLGLVEAEMGEHAAAAEHLDYALRNWPTSGKPEKREHVEKVFEGERKLVGALVIKVSVGGARVRLGERDAGPSPLAHRVFVNGGSVRLRVERDGHEPWEQMIAIEPGQQVDVDVVLVKSSTRPGGGPPARPEQPNPTPRPLWPTVTLGVLTGLSTVATASFIGVHVSKAADADNIADEARSAGTRCSQTGSSGGACKEFADVEADSALFGNLSIGAGALTGVALAGLLTYALWPETDREPAAGASRFAPMHAAHGLVYELSF
jgi:hypothetical protein